MTVAPLERKPIDLPAIPPLQLDAMRWQIITESNFQEQIKKIKDSGMQPVFFALDENGYQALSINMTKIRGYLGQQKAVIYALKSYYGVPDNPESLTPPASTIAQLQQSQTVDSTKPLPAPPSPPETNAIKKRTFKIIPPFVMK